MKLSVRGSIRKAPSSISWCYSLLNIGEMKDAGSLIRLWQLICHSILKC